MTDTTPSGLSEASANPEDTVPISQLGVGSSVVRQVAETGRPKVVTENGAAIAAIVDAATYRLLREDFLARSLAADLQYAMRQVEAGQVMEHDAVMYCVREQFRGRISSTLQRRLDRL